MKIIIKYFFLIAVFIGVQSKVVAFSFKYYNSDIINSASVIKSLKHIEDQTLPSFNLLIDVESDVDNYESVLKTDNYTLIDNLILKHNNLLLLEGLKNKNYLLFLSKSLYKRICVFRI